MNQNYYDELGIRQMEGFAPALIFVDVIRAYTDPHSPLFLRNACQTLDRIMSVAKFLNKKGHPIIYTRPNCTSAESTSRCEGSEKVLVFGEKRADSGWNHYADDALIPRHSASLRGAHSSQELIKSYASAFAMTNLAFTLKKKGCNAVFIAGFTTGGSIRSTATDAISQGFRTFVLTEAVADRSQEISKIHLNEIRNMGAEVISLEQAYHIYSSTFQTLQR